MTGRIYLHHGPVCLLVVAVVYGMDFALGPGARRPPPRPQVARL